MSGRHRALTRRPWWQVVLAPRRRGLAVSGTVRDAGPGTTATALLAGAGLAGVLVGSTLPPGAGTAVMAVSALVPSVVLGARLARTRTALAHESWQRHRLAGEVAVSDEQVRRLADRVGLLADQGVDDAAELERTRRQLRRSRVEQAGARVSLAGTRAELAGARHQAARAADDAARATTTAADRATEVAARAGEEAEAARAARDEALAQVERAVAEADAAALAAREADALVRRAVPEQAGWRPAARVVGQRSFASVDLRVFDAFTESDMADEDAVLDAPVRRGRHVAELDPARPGGAVATATASATATATARATATRPGTGPSTKPGIGREVA